MASTYANTVNQDDTDGLLAFCSMDRILICASEQDKQRIERYNDETKQALIFVGGDPTILYVFPF